MRRTPSTRVLLVLAAILGFGMFLSRNAALEACLRDQIDLGRRDVAEEELLVSGTRLQQSYTAGGPQSDEVNAWKDHNHRTFKILLGCLAARSCGPNQDKIVILEEADYRKAFVGVPGGERIFARSILKTLDENGVTYLFARGMDQVVGFYNMFPDLIKATVVSATRYDECWHDWEGNCLKSVGNPRGVPIQDLFIPQFFGRDAPLPKDHAEWALVPEDIRNQNNTYIGYSIEDECMKRPFVPTESRPRQVWILGKLSKFFTAQFYPYSRDVWVRAAQELDVEFVSAFNEGEVFPGIRNLRSIKTGPLFGKEEFEREIGQSLAIVGLGDPPISPTPWYGLCYGTPFLNPVKTHLEDDGTIRIARSQHPHVGAIPEPHVYNVPQSDRQDALVADDELIDALKKAITIHERFVPEAMRQDAMNKRVMDWLSRDWKVLMAEKMEAETEWAGEARKRQLVL